MSSQQFIEQRARMFDTFISEPRQTYPTLLGGRRSNSASCARGIKDEPHVAPRKLTFMETQKTEDDEPAAWPDTDSDYGDYESQWASETNTSHAPQWASEPSPTSYCGSPTMFTSQTPTVGMPLTIFDCPTPTYRVPPSTPMAANTQMAQSAAIGLSTPMAAISSHNHEQQCVSHHAFQLGPGPMNAWSAPAASPQAQGCVLLHPLGETRNPLSVPLSRRSSGDFSQTPMPQWQAMTPSNGNMGSSVFTVGSPCGSVHSSTAASRSASKSSAPSTVTALTSTMPSMPTGNAANEFAHDVRAEVEANEVCNASQANITTLMVRNIPRDLSQSVLLQTLDESGFRGLYDFCYAPRSFNSAENFGYAFVNLVSSVAAGALIGAWHRQMPFGPTTQPMSLSPATLQGLEANKKKWCTSRLRRVRNPEFRPFIGEQVSVSLQDTVEALSPAGKSTRRAPRPQMKRSMAR